MIKASKVSKSYRERFWAGARRRTADALIEVDLTIRRGSILGLVGDSGAGKSTLARCLAGLEKPDSGEVWLDNRNLYGLSGSEFRQLRKTVQLVFQSSAAALNPWFTLEEIVAEPLRIEGVPLRKRRERALSLMEQVGLPPNWRARKPLELSGGQRQRLAVARSLAANPNVVIFDEALSGLDLSIQAQMVDLLLEVKEARGLTYLFISHDLLLARRVSEEIAVLHEHRIVEHAPTEALFASPVHPRTRLLLEAIPKLP